MGEVQEDLNLHVNYIFKKTKTNDLKWIHNYLQDSLHVLNFLGALRKGRPQRSTSVILTLQQSCCWSGSKGWIRTVRHDIPVNILYPPLHSWKWCSMWFYLHLWSLHFWIILLRPFLEVCSHRFAIWQFPTRPTNAHIYRHLWLSICEICQRFVESFGPRLRIASQWSAHQAAAQARCCVHDNTITLRSSSHREDLIRFLQQRQASGSIKLFFYAPFTATSVSTSSTRCEATDIIDVAFSL